MPLPHDLLEQAYHLARREPKRPKQASLRRAISTSYYALFHLLISEATKNWKNVDQRAALGRFFGHGSMVSASNAQRGKCKVYINSNPPPTDGPDLDCMYHLQTISLAFSQTQEQRHSADYDVSKAWTRIEATAILDQVDAAFKSWAAIHSHKFAQEYLLTLLGTPKGR